MDNEKEEKVKKILLATGLTAAAIIAGAALLKKKPKTKMEKGKLKKIVTQMIEKRRPERKAEKSAEYKDRKAKGGGYYFK